MNAEEPTCGAALSELNLLLFHALHITICEYFTNQLKALTGHQSVEGVR